VPRQHHHCKAGENVKGAFPSRFGILCWNVHKANASDRRFAEVIRRWEKRYALHALVWQEAALQDTLSTTWHWDAAANLYVNRIHYGVLTAAKTRPQEVQAWLSDKEELWFVTRKSLLMTRYRLYDGRLLLLVNVHAINFREHGAFEHELSRLFDALKNFGGAVVLAGDFNTWNKARYLRLLRIARALRLKRVPFRKSQGVKSFGGLMLDHMFYRGLNLTSFDVPDDNGISDHRPLIACFST